MMAKANTGYSIVNTEDSGKINTTDIIFLVGIVIAVQGYFVRNLGFYSDDWWILSTLASAKTHSIFEILHSAFGSKAFIVRPVQGLELSVLYWLFGTNPLGYHIVNALTLASGIALFYLTLSQLKVQRTIAVGVPLIYALLPHYSTTRFWIASFTANISIVFFLLNLYAGLRCLSVKNGSVQKRRWLLVSLFSVLASVMAYEVVLPLFFVNFSVFLFKLKKQKALYIAKHKFNIHALLISNILLLIGGIAYKFILSERTGGFNGQYINHVVRVIRYSVTNDYWTYGVKIPIVLWKIIKSYYSSRLFFTATALFLTVFIYLIRIEAFFYEHFDWLKLILVGVVFYFGGYAAFLITTNFQVSAAGISNRITIAAAIGVAVCFVGGGGFLCCFINVERIRNVVFSFLLAGFGFCGYIINCTISHFYIDSYVQELAVLKSIYLDIPNISNNNTIILDGVCPYVGPVPVFDCSWDLSGALALHYKKTIKADVRTRRLSYNLKGIVTYVYGMKSFYPYNKDLFVYNFKDKKTYFLNDFEKANTYFSLISPQLSECSNALEGEGIRIFK